MIITNPVDVDYALESNENQIPGTSMWKFQLDANIQGIAFGRTYALINNSHGAGTLLNQNDAPVGFCGRFLNAATLAEYHINANCNMASGLDLSKAEWSGGSAAAIAAVLDKGLQEIGDPEGDDILILYNDPAQRAVDACVRYSSGQGGFSVDRDQWGRAVTTYKNAKLVNVGRQPPDVAGNQELYNISNAESSTGGSNAGAPSGSNTYTSFWFVKVGQKDGFMLWQLKPVETTPRYPLQGGTFSEMVIRWSMGLWQQYTRSIVRLYGVNLAGV
jgi:hypothetical protein